MHKCKNLSEGPSDPNVHVDLAFYRSTPLGPGLPGPATLLFDRPIRVPVPKVNRAQINNKNYNDHYNHQHMSNQI